MKNYEPMTHPRGEFFFEGVVDISGHPYAIFKERIDNERGGWVNSISIRPFVEVIEDVTNGPDEPLPDGSGHPDHTRKRR